MRKRLFFLLILTLTITPFIILQAINPGGSWSEQIQLSSNITQPAVAPQVAADCDGNALVIWKQIDHNSGDRQIFANRYDAGAGWQEPTMISNQAKGHVIYEEGVPPALKFDCKGNAIALWVQGNNFIYYNRYDADEKQWIYPPPDNSISGKWASNPQFAFDCNGNGFAVWDEFDAEMEKQKIYARRYNAGTWGTTTTVLSNVDAERPAIAIDCKGNATVVWEQKTTIPPKGYRAEAHPAIYANTYNAAMGEWGTPPITPISDPTFNDGWRAQVAYDCNGIATAVWQQDDGTGTTQIYANRYTPGSGWGPAPTTPISDSIKGNAVYPQLVVDCTGNVTVVWQQGNQIYTNRYAHGSWETPPTTPISDPTKDAYFPELVVDCAGNVTASWLATNDQVSIYTNRYTLADGWAPAPTTPRSNPSLGYATFPQMAATCNGFVVLVYQQGNPEATPSTEQIFGQLFIPTGQPRNVRARQECHRFPTQIDLINVISWDPPASANPIVKYNVYCAPYVAPTSCCTDCCDCQIVCCTCPCNDAKLVDEVPATGPLYFCHHGRCAGMRYSYCITAVDTTGSETPVPATVATS